MIASNVGNDNFPPRLVAGASHAAVRACLGCDCTDDRACVDNDGVACHWVGPQLCSSCAKLADQLGLGT